MVAPFALTRPPSVALVAAAAAASAAVVEHVEVTMVLVAVEDTVEAVEDMVVAEEATRVAAEEEEATMAVVDNTTLEVVNLTVADMTIRREAAEAVAAGKPILDEIPTRPTFLRTVIHRAEGQTVLQTILTDDSGQERMGGKTLVAGIAFGS